MSEFSMERDWQRHLDGPIEAMEHVIGAEILADAVAYCPKKTGALAASLKLEVSGRTFRISSDKDYAAPVELGHHLIAWGHDTHRFVPAQPYMRPALYKRRAL